MTLILQSKLPYDLMRTTYKGTDVTIRDFYEVKASEVTRSKFKAYFSPNEVSMMTRCDNTLMQLPDNVKNATQQTPRNRYHLFTVQKQSNEKWKMVIQKFPLPVILNQHALDPDNDKRFAIEFPFESEKSYTI